MPTFCTITTRLIQSQDGPIITKYYAKTLTKFKHQSSQKLVEKR